MTEPKQMQVSDPSLVVAEVVDDGKRTHLYVNSMSEDLAASLADRYPEANFFFVQLDSI